MNAGTLTAQLRELYAETHLPELAAGEFTISMFARANGCGVGPATRLIRQALDEGRIMAVGDRLYDGRRSQAFRLVEPA